LSSDFGLASSELAQTSELEFSGDELETQDSAETLSTSPRKRPRVDPWSSPLYKTKLARPSSSLKPRSATPKVQLKKKDGLEQLVLDFGQKNRGPRTCKECGMTFNHTAECDEGFHMIYHNAVLSGADYPTYKDENAVDKRWNETYGNTRVVLVTRHSSIREKKKVRC